MASSRNKWTALLSVALLVLITVAVNLAVMGDYRARNQDAYLAAIIDKEALLKNTPSPKVIIIGGSNAAFGFDSKKIADALGMPVVNTGLQAGLGLRYSLNFVKPYIHAGDILLVSPEYENLLGNIRGGEVLGEMLMLYPGGIKYLSSWNEFWELAKVLPALQTEMVHQRLEDEITNTCKECNGSKVIYFRSAFDPQTGDITTNKGTFKGSGGFEFTLNYTVPNSNFEQNIRFLNKFNRFVTGKGASMIYVYPSIVNAFDDSVKKTLSDTDAVLRQQLEFPILEDQADTFFPQKLMFDTEYHLNDAGRTLRTDRVIKAVCTLFSDLDCRKPAAK